MHGPVVGPDSRSPRWTSRGEAQYSVLGSADDGSRSDGDEALSLAVEHGDVAKLRRLSEEGQWWDCEEALVRAALTGHLVALLECFELPLRRHPRKAKEYEQKARARFLKTAEDDDEEVDGECGRSWWERPSRFALLLSNYLLVPQTPVVEWLEASEMHMVVFKQQVRSSADAPQTWQNGGSPQTLISNFSGLRGRADSTREPVPVGFDRFPSEIGVLYLVPWIDKPTDLEYSRAQGMCCLRVGGGGKRVDPRDDRIMLPCTAAFQFPPDELESEECRGIIPENAEKFACVYPDANQVLPGGGFVYLDGAERVLAVMRFTQTQCTSYLAIRLGHMQPIRPDIACQIEKDARDTTLPVITSRGARKYCFVGPGEYDEGIKIGPLGGFSYFFSNKQGCCFFHITGYCQVVERGPAHSVGSASMFCKHPKCDQIEDSIVKRRCRCLSFFHEDASDDVEIVLAKIQQPGLGHPVVLRSLVNTRNTAALESRQIQAIVTAVLNEFNINIIMSFLGQLFLLVCVSHFTRYGRRRTTTTTSANSPTCGSWQWTERAAFLTMSLLWFAMVVRLIFYAHGYWLTFGELKGLFLASGRIAVLVLQAIALLCLKVMLWHSVECTGASDILEHLSRTLSFTGALSWVHLLYLLRGFIPIGSRFLPITEAWKDATSFLLVTLFLLGAAFQVSYALTNLPVQMIILDTFRMGFLNELKPRMFVDSEVDIDEHPGWEVGTEDWNYNSRVAFSYTILILFSFIIMVSTANIFIQVMGDAYTSNKKHVHVTLTRARAREALIQALACVGCSSLCCRFRCCRFAGPEKSDADLATAHVWFTRMPEEEHADKEEEEDKAGGGGGGAGDAHERLLAAAVEAMASAAGADGVDDAVLGQRLDRGIRAGLAAARAARDL